MCVCVYPFWTCSSQIQQNRHQFLCFVPMRCLLISRRVVCQVFQAVQSIVLTNPVLPQNMDGSPSESPASQFLTLLRLPQPVNIPTPVLAVNAHYFERLLHHRDYQGFVQLLRLGSKQEMASFKLIYDDDCRILENYGAGMLCASSPFAFVQPGRFG